MILDHLHNANPYLSLSPRFKNAFDHLTSADFSTLGNGKHVIDGDDLFLIVMEYETKKFEDCVMENHRKYIDIQYMISGEELVGIETFSNQVPTTPYDETKEAAFYEKKYTSTIRLRQNHFAIFYPQDLHMPSLEVNAPALVRKAVYKVRA